MLKQEIQSCFSCLKVKNQTKFSKNFKFHNFVSYSKDCLQLKSCESCLHGIGNFNCLWCPTLQRCSDTMDRYRQEWIESSCPVELNVS